MKGILNNSFACCRKPTESRYTKSEGLVKKREEWIKNWVSRKYNKPKFPRVVVPPFTPNTQVYCMSKKS